MAADRSLGKWTLVGTTMAPGFDVTGFEMRDEGGCRMMGGRACELSVDPSSPLLHVYCVVPNNT